MLTINYVYGLGGCKGWAFPILVNLHQKLTHHSARVEKKVKLPIEK